MKVLTRGPGETMRTGYRLGRLLKRGQTVCLYGPLGAGKTTFVKGIAQALGISERDIMSASFTMISEHPAETPLYHIDLYRVEKGSDLETIGVEDYLGGDGVAVIEWAEKLPLEDAVSVRINFVSGDTREIIIEGIDETHWDNRQSGPA